MLPLLNSVGAEFEGKYFPVVSKFEITKIETTSENQSFVWLHFEKLRNCKYIGMTWQRKTASGYIRVAVDTKPTLGSPQTRPLGKAEVGPWLVDMPPEDIREQVRITLLHACGLFYQTQTEVYP